MARMQKTAVPAIAATGQRDPHKFPTTRLWAVGVVAAMLAALGGASPSHAGVVLVSRQTSLQATGDPGAGGTGGFNLTDGTTGFNSFANDLTSSTGGPAAAEAHQYSIPAVTGNLFQGAYADGSVMASISARGATAWAQSVMALTFKVDKTPVQYNFSGEFGSAGLGSTGAQLIHLNTPGVAVSLFNVQVDAAHGASQTVNRQGTLQPGSYNLKVSAQTAGVVTLSSAYYTMNMTLSPTTPSGPPASVPLPPALWPALTLLATLGILTRHRVRRAIV